MNSVECNHTSIGSNHNCKKMVHLFINICMILSKKRMLAGVIEIPLFLKCLRKFESQTATYMYEDIFT